MNKNASTDFKVKAWQLHVMSDITIKASHRPYVVIRIAGMKLERELCANTAKGHEIYKNDCK